MEMLLLKFCKWWWERLTTYIYPDRDADKIAAFSTGGDTVIKSMKILDLSKTNEVISKW